MRPRPRELTTLGLRGEIESETPRQSTLLSALGSLVTALCRYTVEGYLPCIVLYKYNMAFPCNRQTWCSQAQIDTVVINLTVKTCHWKRQGLYQCAEDSYCMVITLYLGQILYGHRKLLWSVLNKFYLKCALRNSGLQQHAVELTIFTINLILAIVYNW